METKLNKTEKAVQKYCEALTKTIKELDEGWRRTWLTTKGGGKAQSGDGRPYNAMNQFLLYLMTDANGWNYPIYITFQKAHELGAHVKKGEKANPVLFWCINAYKNGQRITIDEWRNLPKDEQKEWKTAPVLRTYDVFNIDQTTLKEDNPKAYDKMANRFEIPEMKTEDGMYVNDKLDALIGGGWCCPIHPEKQDRAYYSMATDTITLPLKAQFNVDDADTGGQEYYAAALHEMAHSTGIEKRLNRNMGGGFGSEDYGREELVAELTAAVCGHELGFNTRVEKNNAAYISSWLKSINEQPRFLVSVLSDVSKAVTMVHEHLEKVG